MIRTIAALMAVLALAVSLVACGDDDGGGDSATPTTTRSAVATIAATPSASPAVTPTPEDPITMQQPAPGSTVKVPFEVSGSADVFEAALSVEVTAQDGTVLCRHNIMATSGSGTRGTWTTNMAFPPPAAGGGVSVRAFSISPQDGSEINSVSNSVTLSPDPPAIVISQPACGALVPKGAPIDVRGESLVFEARFLLELQDNDGATLVSEPVMGGGTERLPWQASIDVSTANIAPGQYWLVAYNRSARDGSIENLFSIPVEVSP